MYQLNENYFEIIDSREKAYFLGLIAADGCIHKSIPKKRNTRIALTLKVEDGYIIEKLSEALEFKGNVRIVTIRKGKYIGHKYSHVQFTSNKMAIDLSKYGITRDKSSTLTYPTISKEYDYDFIRGYFDGNGSVFLSNERHRRTGKITPVIHFRFCGPEKLLSEIQSKLGIKGRLVQSKKSFVYELQCKRNVQASIFFNKIYTDTNLYLKRKYDVFKNVQRLQSTAQ